MKVWELAAILEHVDPDAEVCIHGGHGLRHIAEVAFPPSHTSSITEGRYVEGQKLPRVLRLASGWSGGLWWSEPPPVELRGRFRRAAELQARLDPDLPPCSPTWPPCR